MNQEQKNELLANDIRDWLLKNELAIDVRIYFNNKCYDWCGKNYNSTNHDVLENIKGSQFFEYANDETVSMSFEADLYDVLNYGFTSKFLSDLEEEFRGIFSKHGVYYELGHAWNLSVWD